MGAEKVRFSCPSGEGSKTVREQNMPTNRIRPLLNILLLLYTAPLATMWLSAAASGFYHSQPELVRGVSEVADFYDRSIRILLADMLLPVAAVLALRSELEGEGGWRIYLATWFAAAEVAALALLAVTAGLQDRLSEYGPKIAEILQEGPRGYAHESMMYLAVVGGFTAAAAPRDVPTAKAILPATCPTPESSRHEVSR